MTIYLHHLSEQSIFIEFRGLITHQQVFNAYSELACLSFAYLLYDGVDMIYDETAFYGDDLDVLIAQWFNRSDFKFQFLVLPDDHDLRDPVAKSYEDLGYLHKVRFVTSREEGIVTISTLENRGGKTHPPQQEF